MPMAPVVPRARARAAGSGPTYPSFLAASRIRWRIASESWSGRENALDTVILLTPTWSAIVCRVTRATPLRLVGVATRRLALAVVAAAVRSGGAGHRATEPSAEDDDRGAATARPGDGGDI